MKIIYAIQPVSYCMEKRAHPARRRFGEGTWLKFPSELTGVEARIVGIEGKWFPTGGFGPGHEKVAHAPNEEVDVEHLVRAAAFHAGFVEE